MSPEHIVTTRHVVADLIQRILDRTKLSKRQLSIQLGVSTTTMQNWWDARVDLPFVGIVRLVELGHTTFQEVEQMLLEANNEA